MGKRFWLGMGILIFFLVVGIGTVWAMDAIHKPAQQALEQATEKAQSGQIEEAVRLGKQAHARWEKYRKVTASFADHSPMDEADQLFAEMEVFAGEQDAEHFAACCAQLSYLVRSMSDAHRPTWWNFM